MSTSGLLVLVLASALATCGAALVVYRELASSGRRRLVARWRDVAEVATPAIGVIVLLVATWAAAR